MSDDSLPDAISTKQQYRDPYYEESKVKARETSPFEHFDGTWAVNLRQIIATAVELGLQLFESFQDRLMYTWVSICWQGSLKDENSSNKRMQESICCIKDVNCLIILHGLQHSSKDTSFDHQCDEKTNINKNKLPKSVIDLVIYAITLFYEFKYFRDFLY